MVDPSVVSCLFVLSSDDCPLSNSAVYGNLQNPFKSNFGFLFILSCVVLKMLSTGNLISHDFKRVPAPDPLAFSLHYSALTDENVQGHWSPSGQSNPPLKYSKPQQVILFHTGRVQITLRQIQ